jgi:hypothetical protein
MRKKNMAYVILAACLALLAYAGWKLTARSGYESAEYSVTESDGEFEIREYPNLMLVTTEMQFETQGDDGSFMRLFRYISGGNADEQKVSMTTPVFMQRDAQNVPGEMGFVIPRKVAEQGAPEPVGDAVELQQRRGGRFAVIRFAGRMDSKSLEEAEARLRAWLAKSDLVGEEQVEGAGYDPPWTPGPFRRNEVLIRLIDSSTAG